MQYKVCLTAQQITDVSRHRLFTLDLMIIDDGCIFINNYTLLRNILDELKIEASFVKVDDVCYFCL